MSSSDRRYALQLIHYATEIMKGKVLPDSMVIETGRYGEVLITAVMKVPARVPTFPAPTANWGTVMNMGPPPGLSVEDIEGPQHHV